MVFEALHLIPKCFFFVVDFMVVKVIEKKNTHKYYLIWNDKSKFQCLIHLSTRFIYNVSMKKKIDDSKTIEMNNTYCLSCIWLV
jgi:hypothetical protein